MLKRILAVLLVLVVVALCGGLIAFNLFRAKMIGEFFANRPRPTVTVSTLTVETQNWQPGIEAIGTIAARQGVDVANRTSGIVKEVLFKANDKVEKGQLLVQLDDELEQADLIAANANLERDKQALERSKQLAVRGVSSTSALDNAKAALDASISQSERVKAEISLKQIVAPFSGTIGIARIDLGEYLSEGTVIATLQDLDTMKVNFSVPEGQTGSLSLGQNIHVGLDAEHLNYSGKIIGIDPKADPASRLVAVQAEVENKDNGLRPGQFAAVRIELPEETDLIALPQTAVVMSLYGSYVYVIREDAPPAPAKTETNDRAPEAQEPAAKNGEAKASETPPGEADKTLVARQVFVKVGRRYIGRIEITDGLKPGDIVVTAGQNKLSIGSPVTIDNTVTPTLSDAPAGGAS